MIKRTEKKRVVEITRQMAHGLLEQAERLLPLSSGGSVLKTALIERLNATFRERLASLTRKSRHAASRMQALHTGMDLIGCTDNFCCAHQELSQAKHGGRACTPAMASGLTDHVWRIGEWLRYTRGTFAVDRTETTWTTKKAGRASRHADQTSELPTACSALGSSSQGGLLLDHQVSVALPAPSTTGSNSDPDLSKRKSGPGPALPTRKLPGSGN